MPVQRRPVITPVKALAASLLLCAPFARPAIAEDGFDPLSLDLGSGYSMTFYGYVKADAIRDNGYKLGRSTFPIASIGLPTGPATGNFDRVQGDETRIGLDFYGPNDFHARFEGDFFGPNSSLRWRHYYVDWYGVIVGQNWSNFMTVETLADTVEFQGSGAVPFARLPQLRYTYSGLANTQLSASVEEDPANSSDVLLTLAGRYGFDNGMVRLSALSRDTTIAGTPVEGWGLHFSTVLHPWAGGTVKFNATTGAGIADILAAGLSGNALSKGGKEVRTNAIALTLSHQVTDRLKLAATGSWVGLDRATGTDTDSLQTLHLSAFYTLNPRTTLMAEYFTGTRKQGNGASFDADRIQLAVRVDF